MLTGVVVDCAEGFEAVGLAVDVLLLPAQRQRGLAVGAGLFMVAEPSVAGAHHAEGPDFPFRVSELLVQFLGAGDVRKSLVVVFLMGPGER